MIYITLLLGYIWEDRGSVVELGGILLIGLNYFIWDPVDVTAKDWYAW